MKKIYLYLLIIPIILLSYTVLTQASNLAESLKGRILLQVEEHGEAWYISPNNLKRYFLGRPNDAFAVMREQGVGISNSDLAKIPVSLDYLSGHDSSGDGLPDDFKVALGLDVNSTDSDGDGYCDFTELYHGYNPLGPGRLNHDLDFAKSQAGRILLQVEQNGEAWYVSPENNKRYFLGRPADAFAVMRNLGLGISNENLERIEVEDNESVLVPLEFIDCGYIDYHEMILSMTSGDKSYWEDKTYNASKTALYCINDAMIKCQAAVFRVQGTDENPAFPSDDDFSVPEMFLIIKGEEKNDMCRINNCLIPKEAILNHYNYKGDNFIFTLVGFSPQLEGSEVENNDLYDPITKQVYKGVCPVKQGIFTSNIVIPEELIIEEKEQSISHRKTSDIKQIQTALQLYFEYNNEYPSKINDLGDLLKPIPIAPTPADCVNNDYIYTAFSDETGLNTKYCLRYCLSQDISIFSAGDPIYATHEHVNTGSICPFN